MAEYKGFKYVVQVETDGATKEVEKSITSINEFQTRIADLQKQINETAIGTDKYNDLKKELKSTQKEFNSVSAAQKGWLDTISEAPGPVGLFGQSLKGIGKAFDGIGMAIKTSLIGFLATIIVQLVEKFKNMEGVMDPLNKIFGLWSTVMGKLASVILPPVAAVIETIANGAVKLIGFFSQLAGGSGDLGNAMSDLADRQDALNDSQADYELGLSKSNRALAEARDVANDQTKSTKERKDALLNAAAIEKQIAAEGKARALEQARITAGQMAASMNLTETEIAGLKKANAAELEAFAQRIKNRKDLNAEQRAALLKSLGDVEEIAAQSAKIDKKTDTQVRALENEAAARKKEEADKAAAAAKERKQKELEAAKGNNDALIELEKNKYNTDEATLRKYLEEKDRLDNEGTKKSKAQLELQKQNREKAIKDALKADKDAIDAANKLESDNYLKRLDKEQKFTDSQVAIKQEELRKVKLTYGEDSEEYKKKQNEIYQIQADSYAKQLQALQEKVESGAQLSQEEWDRYDQLGLKVMQTSNTIAEFAAKDTLTEKQRLDLQKKNLQDQRDYEMSLSGTTYDEKRAIIDKEKEDEDKDYADKLAKAGEDKDKKTALEIEHNKKLKTLSDARVAIDEAEYAARMKSVKEFGDMLGALSNLVGQETEAGKALGIAQALINTYIGASEALKQKSTLPSPFDVIAKVVNVATVIATGLKTVQQITSVTVPTADVPEVRIRKAMGGILQGPSHAMGGIATPFGELEGGEYVINKTATQMYRPQLDKINSMGGKVEYGPDGTYGGNTTTNLPTPIIKTYVVASEMTSQQQMEKVIKERSKI